MDLRLNATRRSTNLSVYLVHVFDLGAGRFKFLGENLLSAGKPGGFALLASQQQQSAYDTNFVLEVFTFVFFIA